MRSAVFAIALVCVFSPLTGQRPAIEPNHTVEINLDFSPATSVSHWVAGYLPRFSRTLGGGRPKVWMLDKFGKTTISETEIWFPEATQVAVRAVTADREGNLYASAEVWSSKGAGAGVICKVSPGGKAIRVTRTDDFIATSLAVSNEGDVWAFGLPLLLWTTKSSSQEYSTLWHFDRSGTAVAQLLPRSGFSPNLEPAHFFGSTGGPHLCVTGKRLGLFSATSGRWVEFELNTSTKTVDLTVPAPVGQNGVKAALTELVMTEPDNDVYAFFAYRDSEHQNSLFYLDKVAGKWIFARATSSQSEFGGLYGSDGADLILRSGPKTFGWIPNQAFLPATPKPSPKSPISK